MLTGKQPFVGNNEKDLFSKISRCMFRIPETTDFEAKRLLNKILNFDPDKRPSAHELANDRWLCAFASKNTLSNTLSIKGKKNVE